MRRREFTGLLASGLFSTALSSSTFSVSAALADDGAPIKGGTFIAAIDPEPAQLNTTFHNQYANAAVGANVFDGLLSYDAEQKPVPALATSWSVSDDNLAITFNLRKGVKWHDGKDFTSADVRFSFLEVLKKVHPRGRVTFEPITDVETPDPYTAIFRLKRPAPVILSSLNTTEAEIVPKHLYEGTDIRTNPYNAKPVGTGPFKFKEWKKGQYVELERNPDYWDTGKPYLDRVIFRTIPDAAGRAAALETGDIVYLPYSGVPFSDVGRLRELPDLAFDSRGYSYNAQIYFLEINLRRPILDNVKVRQAIAHSIDKQGLVDTVWYGLSKTADGPIPASLPKYYTDEKPRYPLDLAAAEKLLDEAGYPRKADGIRFSIKLNLSPSSDAFVPAGEYLRQNLKKVGIEVTPIALDQPSYLKTVYTNYDFDIILQPYSVLFDPEMGLTRVLSSKAASPGVPYVNASGYASEAVDKIIAAYQREVDPEKRIKLFHDLQRAELADLPLIPLLESPFFTLYNRKVHGLNFNPDGARSSFADVWLSP